MNIRENSFWYKLKEKLVPILAVIVVAVLIWIAFGNKIPGLIPLLKEGDGQKIADYLSQETGIKGIIAVILLQMIQVASIVMPGMAIQVASGLIYGWLEGFLMCYFGFVLSNFLIFLFRDKAAVYGGDRQHGSGHSQRGDPLYSCQNIHYGQGVCEGCRHGQLAADPDFLHGGAVYHSGTMAVHRTGNRFSMCDNRGDSLEERMVHEQDQIRMQDMGARDRWGQSIEPQRKNCPRQSIKVENTLQYTA